MNKSFIINELRNSKKELEERFSISRIGLFGSYSRNDQTAKSDIDIIYELVEGKRLGLKEVYDLEVFFKDKFNIERIDLVNSKYINPIIESEMIKSVIYV
jgi:predicted nucleotidyltransferase